MLCLSCGRRLVDRDDALCRPCLRDLRPASDRWIADGLVARAAFDHEGAARRLVHRLKYGGLPGAARFLAARMAPLLPATTACLVPIPRAAVRRWQHGVDPAAELARALSAELGIPVTPAIRSGLWWPRHAGSGRDDRRPPRLSRVGPVPVRAALVDDVCTTGATAREAARLFPQGSMTLVTATAAGTLEGRSRERLRRARR